MAKPPPIRFPSDDCPLTLSGQQEICYPHVGEWVELLPVMSVGELQQVIRFEREAERDGALDELFESLCEALAGRITAWSWTDLRGRPLPPPDSPAALKRLTSEELFWLLRVSRDGETETQRKNAGSGSPTIS